jgi:hypothetical protein
MLDNFLPIPDAESLPLLAHCMVSKLACVSWDPPGHGRCWRTRSLSRAAQVARDGPETRPGSRRDPGVSLRPAADPGESEPRPLLPVTVVSCQSRSSAGSLPVAGPDSESNLNPQVRTGR